MQRPDPMIPSKPGAEDIQAMSNRQAWLVELFFLDGRDRKDHPQHGLSPDWPRNTKLWNQLTATDG